MWGLTTREVAISSFAVLVPSLSALGAISVRICSAWEVIQLGPKTTSTRLDWPYLGVRFFWFYLLNGSHSPRSMSRDWGVTTGDIHADVVEAASRDTLEPIAQQNCLGNPRGITPWSKTQTYGKGENKELLVIMLCLDMLIIQMIVRQDAWLLKYSWGPWPVSVQRRAITSSKQLGTYKVYSVSLPKHFTSLISFICSVLSVIL